MDTNHWRRLDKRGMTFTELGMGTAPLGNLYKAITEGEANATLEKAWQVGCRYFDTAPLYGLGLAETRMNRFLKGKPRDEYVLSTKAGRIMEVCSPEHRTGIGKFFETPTRREMFDYSYNGIMRSFFASGIRAMTMLRDQGVVGAIGAGLNEWQAAETLLEKCDMDLFLLAGRYTLLEQDALESFLPLCEARSVGIVLGGPYNSGILATGAQQGAYYNYDPAPLEILERVKKIEAVCESHDVKLIEAALRFPLHHPCVVTTIPGAQSVSEVESNAENIAAVLPAALWSDLKSEGLLRKDAPTP